MSPTESNSADTCICTVNTPTIALQILEELSSDDENDGLEDSIGRFVWPTAVPLLRHMLSGDDTIFSKSSLIVELGAGCGVLGMGLAAAVGTGQHTSNNGEDFHAILTDHDSDWLQRNVTLNEALLREASAATVAVTRMEWGNPRDIETVRNMIQEKLSTSNKNNLVIVGSDILYNHESHRSLASALYQLSKVQPTRILLGFPDRDNDEESFVPIAREFFGDALPPSKPIINNRKSNKGGKTMDLRVIDFNV